jgi:flavin reductase (DIM6/NTAB) family NADH-FMN oxidoreductase RutF
MKKADFDFQSPANVLKLSFFLGNGQVVLITSCDAQKKVQGILTASWMTLTSHFPLLLTISVGNGKEGSEGENYRSTYALIEETLEFGLNLPSKEQIEVVGKIGTLHSNRVNKYTETGLTPMESKIIKANLIKECYLNMECKVTDEYITGDHTVFVAEPVLVHLDEDVLVNGKFSEKYRSKHNQIHFGDIIDLWNMW